MKGNETVIFTLNERLVMEWTGIQQYLIHRATLAVWEYPKLLEYLEERITDEQRHYNMLAERIRFLEGQPFYGTMNPVSIGQDILTMYANDLATELDAVQKYNETIQICLQAGDSGTRGIIESILSDEEDHSRDLQAQLTQIAQMSVENYLSSKL